MSVDEKDGILFKKIALEHAIQSQQSATINSICPLISLLRMMKSKKPVPVTNFYNANFDVIIDDIVYRKEEYRKIIPNTINKLHAIFNLISIDEEWKKFVFEPLMIQDWITLKVRTKSGISLKEIKLIDNKDCLEINRKELVPIIKMCLQGFGVGICRLEELNEEYGSHNTSWHNGCLYYYT